MPKLSFHSAQRFFDSHSRTRLNTSGELTVKYGAPWSKSSSFPSSAISLLERPNCKSQNKLIKYPFIHYYCRHPVRPFSGFLTLIYKHIEHSFFGTRMVCDLSFSAITKSNNRKTPKQEAGGNSSHLRWDILPPGPLADSNKVTETPFLAKLHAQAAPETAP